MNIGRRFKRIRENHHLTQAEAAKQLGIKSYQLANYESNRSEPTISTLKGMSKLYGVSIDFLLGNVGIYENESFKEMESSEEENFNELKKKIIKALEDYSKDKE